MQLGHLSYAVAQADALGAVNTSVMMPCVLKYPLLIKRAWGVLIMNQLLSTLIFASFVALIIMIGFAADA
jgi:hypothetical protein